MTQSLCQQVRKASFHGQSRLIFRIRFRAWRTSRPGMPQIRQRSVPGSASRSSSWSWRPRRRGSGYYDKRISAERKIRNHVRSARSPRTDRHHRADAARTTTAMTSSAHQLNHSGTACSLMQAMQAQSSPPTCHNAINSYDYAETLRACTRETSSEAFRPYVTNA